MDYLWYRKNLQQHFLAVYPSKLPIVLSVDQKNCNLFQISHLLVIVLVWIRLDHSWNLVYHLKRPIFPRFIPKNSKNSVDWSISHHLYQAAINIFSSLSNLSCFLLEILFDHNRFNLQEQLLFPLLLFLIFYQVENQSALD